MGVDRTVDGWEGLMAAQECLPTNTEKDKFAADYRVLNKVWNASKFVLNNLEDYDENYEPKDLQLGDKWILSKVNSLAKEMSANIDNYDLGVATQKIYDFIWNEFCDWYIEIAKTRLYDENCTTKQEAKYTLKTVLEYCLKMLHPIMPFVTEKIYKELPGSEGSIMI